MPQAASITLKENVKTRFGPKAADMVFPITKFFSTVPEETLWSKLQVQSNKAFQYLGITQWWNSQWVTTRKFPLPQRLPAQYQIVTFNTSECINSMTEEYWGESWMESLDGTLHLMMQRISNKRQADDTIPKEKAILGESFHKAAVMEVVELVQGRQYMVTEKKVPC